MKFSKLRQLLLVSAIGLVVATIFSGCQLVTIDYALCRHVRKHGLWQQHHLPEWRDRNLRGRFGVRRNTYRRSAGLLRRHHAYGACPLSRLPEPLRRQSGGHEHRPLRSRRQRRAHQEGQCIACQRHPYPWRSVPTATRSMSFPELPRQRCLPTRSRPALWAPLLTRSASRSQASPSDSVVPTDCHCPRKWKGGLCDRLRPVLLQPRRPYNQYRQPRMVVWIHHRLRRSVDRDTRKSLQRGRQADRSCS